MHATGTAILELAGVRERYAPSAEARPALHDVGRSSERPEIFGVIAASASVRLDHG